MMGKPSTEAIKMGFVAELGCDGPPNREGAFLCGWPRTWEAARPTHPLLNTGWPDNTRTIDVHICWLRRKSKEDPHRPVYSRTVRGVGRLIRHFIHLLNV